MSGMPLDGRRPSSRPFTEEQVQYLCSLPAVATANATRIIYADWFRDQCLQRYLAGEHPVDLFREAGLDPKLIGYKRIERAFARWRANGRIPGLPAGRPRRATLSTHGVGTIGHDGEPATYAGGDSSPESAEPQSNLYAMMLRQQAHYIRYLEQEVHRLRTAQAQ